MSFSKVTKCYNFLIIYHLCHKYQLHNVISCIVNGKFGLYQKHCSCLVSFGTFCVQRKTCDDMHHESKVLGHTNQFTPKSSAKSSIFTHPTEFLFHAVKLQVGLWVLPFTFISVPSQKAITRWKFYKMFLQTFCLCDVGIFFSSLRCIIKPW